jgi:hypothetical protein
MADRRITSIDELQMESDHLEPELCPPWARGVVTDRHTGHRASDAPAPCLVVHVESCSRQEPRRRRWQAINTLFASSLRYGSEDNEDCLIGCVNLHRLPDHPDKKRYFNASQEYNFTNHMRRIEYHESLNRLLLAEAARTAKHPGKLCEHDQCRSPEGIRLWLLNAIA